MIKIKRVYDNVTEEDGFRVLVDRIWPRGLSKENAQIDYWPKEVAPSEELRKWFAHDPEKWSEFKEKYKEELSEKDEEIVELKELAQKNEELTLLYAAKDKDHNNAVILKDFLKEHLS
mgnify:CR=1 FL=1